MRILSGEGSAAGNNVNLDYINGSGIGGIGPTHGSPGMAILRPQAVTTLQRMSSHTEGDTNNTDLSLVIEESHCSTKSEFHYPFSQQQLSFFSLVENTMYLMTRQSLLYR